jgi:hypothetical protein
VTHIDNSLSFPQATPASVLFRVRVVEYHFGHFTSFVEHSMGDTEGLENFDGPTLKPCFLEASTADLSSSAQHPRIGRLTIRVTDEDLVFRFIDNPIRDPSCLFPRSYPTGVEGVDFGELCSEEQTCGAGADDEDVDS